MADEAEIRCALQIVKDNLSYQSEPQSFNLDVTGTKGPSPGAMTITTTGEDITFGELTQPSLVRIINYSTTRTVHMGIHDGVSLFPLFQLRPGAFMVADFSSYLGQELGSGTGTSGPTDNKFHMVSVGGDANVSVEAFEV